MRTPAAHDLDLNVYFTTAPGQRPPRDSTHLESKRKNNGQFTHSIQLGSVGACGAAVPRSMTSGLGFGQELSVPASALLGQYIMNLIVSRVIHQTQCCPVQLDATRGTTGEPCGERLQIQK